MKPEFDREIEALLRGGTGRARGDFARAPALDSSHMDADELSAYAENALPPATRARYTAHLADCDDCRRIVTGVALASGAAPVLEKRVGLASVADAVAASPREKLAGPSAWLAALFSPRGLRWAVPVLAIALTGVVAYVALRSRVDNGMLAGRSEREAQRQTAVTANNATESPSTATNTTTAADATAAFANANMNANTNAGGEAPAAANVQQSAEAKKDAAASGPAQVARAKEEQAGAATFDSLSASQPRTTSPGDNRALADASKSAAAPVAEVAVTAAAPSPKAAESERAEASDDELRRGEDARRAKEKDSDAFGRNASRRAANDEAPSGARNETTQKRAQPPPPPASARAQRGSEQNRDSGGLSSRNRSARGTTGEREDAPSERRSVAGYQFRRQDGAWVDVRYDDSMRTRDIGRGTESFRTLAADFPEVQSIAARLSGTVVVVLGGRAYRIN